VATRHSLGQGDPVERRRDHLLRHVVTHLQARWSGLSLGVRARGSLGHYSWIEFQLRPLGGARGAGGPCLVLYHFSPHRRLAACLYWPGDGPALPRRMCSWAYPAEACSGLGPHLLGRAVHRWLDSALGAY